MIKNKRGNELKGKGLSLRDRITKILIEEKLITEEGIKKAVEQQKKKGGKLSDILVSMRLISKKDLTVILCEEFGAPVINLSRYKISPEVILLIPKKMAKQYSIMPISKIGNILTVAMSDPLDVLAIDSLKSITGCDIGLVIADEKDISNAIASFYEGVSHETIEQLAEGTREEEVSILEDKKDSGVTQEEGIRLAEDPPIVRLTNLLLTEAIKMRASDILIEPLDKELRVRYRVDGILIEGRKLPRKAHSAVISRLKVLSDLNISERRLPQDGRFKIKMKDREIDFRLSILPSNMGERAALRILDKLQAMLKLDKLGFESKPLNDLKKASQTPHGMILVCGPTGCGKTTTLYSVLKYIDSPEKNIVTVEDPVEYQLFGINQVSIRPNIGLTFAGALRSILRQDPDIVMVGEIRDFETVDIAIKASLTGHLVLSTLHTTTASGSVVRLINMGVEPFLISSSVLIVAAQRLVRKICPQCKEPYELGHHIAERLNLKEGITVFRGKGCEKCQQVGYKGRLGIIESLILTPTIKDLILERTEEHVINEAAHKEGMKSLRQNAVTKMLAGVTSVEEVMRVTVGEQDIAIT